MANTNTPYIAKNAAPLVNPTVATVFTQTISPIATVASTQAPKAAFVRYACYASYGAGTSNNINVFDINIRAVMRVTGGTATNFTPTLLLAPANTALTLPAGFSTTVGSGAATAFNTASGVVRIAFNLVWDATSGQIDGTVSTVGGVGGAFTTSAAITPVTGFSLIAPQSTSGLPGSSVPTPTTGELSLLFALSGVFSAGNANNIAYLDSFEVEVN